MKTKYKYIHFRKLLNPGKKVWKYICITNEGGKLGYVKWSGAWWKYLYHPISKTSYDSQCNRDIADFTEQLTRAQRAVWAQNRKKNK